MSDHTPAQVTTPDAAPILTVKFNHESRALDADTAARYAQMGMKYEAMLPTLDRLTAVAASRHQTLDQYVTAALTDDRHARLAQYTEELGDADAAARRVAEETLAAEDARLATELAELQDAGVTVSTTEEIPAAVREDARQNGRTLLDAYLRYDWRERAAVTREHAVAAAAASAAVGSQSAPPPENSTDALTHAMRTGLYSVL